MPDKKMKQTWYERTWRPAMAYLYFFLCILDYGVRPAINMYFFREFNLTQTISAIKELDSGVQIQIIDALRTKEAISPILTEFVHLSFGGILGIAAFTRGREELERTKRVDPKTLENNPTPNEKDDELDEADDGSVG